MKRRDFIKNMGIYASTLSPLARGLGTLGLFGTTALHAQNFGDYKAIVILDMDGGNDAMNMFPPTASVAHATYKKIRTNLAVSLVDLFDDEHYNVDGESKHFTSTKGANQPYFVEGALRSEDNKDLMYTKGSYHLNNKNREDASSGLGIHALMPEMASLYNKGKLCVVANSGILVKPTTKAQIEDGSATLPEFLFSHGNQRQQMGTLLSGIPGKVKSGWAGRLADRWSIDNILGLNIAYGGKRLFMGLETSPLSLNRSGPDSYASNRRMSNIESVLTDFADNTSNENIFDRFTNKLNKRTAILSTALKDSWSNAADFSTFNAKNAYGDSLFSTYVGSFSHRTELGTRTHHGPDKGIFEQLEAVAKMIKISKDTLSAKRQIFSVRQGGHDVHSKQLESHSKNIRAISLSVSDFYKALEEMGLEKEVLLISASEFGRTMKSNADGTDHGWGGHHFMLCGDDNFNGGNVFGDVLTDLTLEGENAYTKRARIIPTTSLEQIMAPALKWFGVDDSTMDYVLPNLKNFSTDVSNTESAFLQGVFGGESALSEEIL